MKVWLAPLLISVDYVLAAGSHRVRLRYLLYLTFFETSLFGYYSNRGRHSYEEYLEVLTNLSAPDMTTTPVILKVSKDGYIRLTCMELQTVRLTHLTSGLDDIGISRNEGGATHSAITGYTEWVSSPSPQITIGWDWEMRFANNRLDMHRTSDPRSNLMLLDAIFSDFQYLQSIRLQATFVDNLAWQATVQEYIKNRYR